MSDILLDLDGLAFHAGYPRVSPYYFEQGFSPKPGKVRADFITGARMHGSLLAGGQLRRDNREWEMPLGILDRFDTAYTNLCTNPRLGVDATGWAAVGSASVTRDTDPDDFMVAPASLAVTTTAAANDGGKFTFTATAVAHSASIWVKVAAGAAMAIKFDGETATTFTGTGGWQEVKTQNITLTAASRYVQVYQTDSTARTFHVQLLCLTATASAVAFFDGASGDGDWNGTAHASTSTCLTGQDAISCAVGRLAGKTRKCVTGASLGLTSVPAYWRPTGGSYKGEMAVRALEGVPEYENRETMSMKVTMVTAPNLLAPESLVATITKYAGDPFLDSVISGVGGDLPAPCRFVLNNTSSQDQRALYLGVQGDETDSTVDLHIPATDFETTGYSGTLTAAVNEVQLLTKSGTISGGTYTITLDGVTTGSIAYDANAATIQAALEALTNLEAGDVTVTGGPISSGNVTFTFGGNYAGRNVGALSITSSLTGGGSATFSTTTAGMPAYVSCATYDEWTTLCKIPFGEMIGHYRMFARVYDAAATTDLYKTKLRISVGMGDMASVVTNTDDVVPAPAVGEVSIVDLGQVHLETMPVGTQSSGAYVSVKNAGTAGNVIRLCEVMLLPITVFSVSVKSPAASTSGTLVARDSFSGASGALTGDAAQLGGTWTHLGGVGDATDFQAASGDAVERTAVSDTSTDVRYGRLVTLNSASHAVVDVSVTVERSGLAADTVSADDGVVARAVDSNNFIVAAHGYVNWASPQTPSHHLVVWMLVAGAKTTLGTYTYEGPYAPVRVRLVIGTDGGWRAYLDGTLRLSGSNAALAAGGAIESGQVGIVDWEQYGSAHTRTLSNFVALSGASPPAVTEDGQALHIRYDGQMVRESSTNDLYGLPGLGETVGIPTLLPAGADGNTNRVAALWSRQNPDLAGDPFPDGGNIQVYARENFDLARWS